MAVVAQLVAAADRKDPIVGTYIHLAAATGMRRAELCALRWSDLDEGAATILVSRTVVSVEKGLVEKDPKTHASRRIALDRKTLDRLESHRVAMVDRTERCGLALASDGFVFSYDPGCLVAWHPDR